MADKVKVHVLRQKVFHDGLSMVVLKPGPDNVDAVHLKALYDEGVIADPGADALRNASVDAGFSDAGRQEGPETEVAEVTALRERVAILESERDNLRVELDAAQGEVARLSLLTEDVGGDAGANGSTEPPTLTGKNKAQLLEIAAAEGVEIEDGATNAAIVDAIEAAREDAAAHGDADDAPAA